MECRGSSVFAWGVRYGAACMLVIQSQVDRTARESGVWNVHPLTCNLQRIQRTLTLSKRLLSLTHYKLTDVLNIYNVLPVNETRNSFQTKLDCSASRMLPAVGKMIGVPLQPHSTIEVLRRPFCTCVFQVRFERGAFQPDCKHPSLILLGRPARAEHHPHEIRLNPSHSVSTKRAAPFEPSSSHSVLRNLGVVSLINHDAVLIKLRENMSPAVRPHGLLFHIRFPPPRL
mmetsp:Transcript_17125/g.37252  ORF Transcript_17125/g.37252 Transcript_17125/m.37252 type:complete len:229 (-) Transcript_17125:83-769(-)